MRRLALLAVVVAGIVSVRGLEGILPAPACRFIQYYQALNVPDGELTMLERAMLSLAMLRHSPANR